MSDPKQRIADRLREADLSTERFIDVKNGAKASVDHEQLAADAVTGNYGIYTNANDRIIVLDVDDYEDVDDKSGLSALGRLPPTLEQRSPHGGTHHLYAVEPTEDGRLIAAALKDEFGTQKGNLAPSWGDVQVANKYVVGAGSQLDGCTKDWCDDCADPDQGYYALHADREIATITAQELLDVLAADPSLSRQQTRSEVGENGPTHTPSPPDDVEERLATARELDDKLDRLMRSDYSDYNGDRSAAEYGLAYKLAFWLGDDKGTIEQVLDHDARTQKWAEREDDSYRESILSAVDEQTEFYDPSDDPTDDAYAPDYDMDEVERAEAILDAERGITDPYGSLIHKEGCYGTRYKTTDDQGNEHWEFAPVTNFTLELEHVIQTYEGKLLTIRVHPSSPVEDSYTVQVHPTVFNSPATFTEEVVRGRTTWFNPQGDVTDTLNELRLTVGHQHAPQHRGTEYIGLHGAEYDEWVTPAGTLSADGWVDNPTYKYYEKGGNQDMESSLEDKWSLDPADGADYDADTVAAICERIPEIRKPDRGLPILGWFYAAPLKPIIHDAEGEFNLLQVTGDTESGKTSTLQAFYQLFGADPAPFGCGDTNFTIEKKFAGSCGLPIWLDEYKPTDLSERKLNWLHRRLREVTREKSVSKGQQDLGEITFKMRAPVVFSGEQTVTEAAVRRRTVMTHLTDQATTGRHQQAYSELTGASYTDEDGEERYPDGFDLHEHALAYYRHVLETNPAEIRDAWQDARTKTREHLAALDVPDLDGTEFQGLQTIVFGVAVFRQFATAMGADESALPDDDAVRNALAHAVSNIGPEGRRREHIDEFIELLEQAAAADYIEEGVDHRVYEPQLVDGEALAFHMPSCFAAVKKYVREYNLESEYALLGKNDYLDSFRDKAEKGESYPVRVNHRVRGIENGSKAVVIDPERAATVLPDGFNIGSFTEASPEIEEDADLASVATPVGSLSGEGNPFATVTVEVVDIDEPENGPAYDAVVRDGSGHIEYVDWQGAGVSAELEAGETYLLQDVRVGFDQNGAMRLEPVANTTTADPIQHGVGHLGGAEPDEDQTSLDTAAADGGQSTETSEELPQKELVQKLHQWTTAKREGGRGAERAEVVAALVEEEGADEERVEHHIDQLVQQNEGGLYEPQEGRLDVL